MRNIMQKTLLLFIITMTLGGCQLSPNINNVSICETQLMKYPQYRDKGPVENYRDLFTSDASFTVPKLNIDLNGHSEISTRVAAALAKNKSIHMITSMNVQPITNSLLTNRSHFILYLSSLEDKTAPTRIFNGRYEDQLVMESGRCYIKSRNVIIDRMDTICTPLC